MLAFFLNWFYDLSVELIGYFITIVPVLFSKSKEKNYMHPHSYIIPLHTHLHVCVHAYLTCSLLLKIDKAKTVNNSLLLS